MIHRLFFMLLGALAIQAVPVKVACVGDSITEGAGLANASIESYPARLQRILGTNNFTVRNFGISGRTLLKKGDLPYWNESAFTQSRSFNPDLVIIQLGTNDSKPQNWRHGTNYVDDYKAMIALYAGLASAPRIYLCTPCPVFGAGAFDINPGVVRTNIAPKIRDLAMELDLPVIDLHTRMTNSAWFPDTVHPNAAGMAVMNAVMFENLFGTPNESRPGLNFERLSATRAVISWPAKWGLLVSLVTTQLRDTNTPWTLIDTAIPYGDGETIRQTNTVSGPIRFFQLKRY